MTETVPPSLDQLAREVAALRRRTQLQGRLAACAVALALAGGMILAASPLGSQSQRMTVQELAIADAQGRTRAALGTTAAGAPQLTLLDAESRERARIALDDKGVPGLVFLNAAGKRQFRADLADDEPSLYWYDKEGRLKMYVDVNTFGAPRFTQRDDQGKDRAVVTINDGIPGILFVDPAGKRRLLINAQPDGSGVFLFDADGAKRAEFSVRTDREGVRMFDDTGEVSAAFPP